MGTPEKVDRKSRCIVLSLHVPGRRSRDALIYGFRPPRTTILAPVSSAAPNALAIAVAGMGARDATILFESGTTDAKLREALHLALPRAGIFTVDPAEARRFFWYFRDSADPLTLGHAAEQDVTGPDYETRRPPSLRGAKGREAKRAEADLRSLALTMGNVLGVRPPLPKPEDGWGHRRLAGAYDALFGMYAGLLHRFGAPLARERKHPSGLTEIVLADRPLWVAMTGVTAPGR